MSIASKLFGIWAVNKTVTNITPIFMRLLAGMAAIAICAFIIMIILAVLLVGGVWLAYGELAASGMDHQTAALIIGSLLLVLLASIMLLAKNHCRRLRATSKRIFEFQPRATRNISCIIDSFLQGLESGGPVGQ